VHPVSRGLPGISKVFTPAILIDGFLGFVVFVTEAPSRRPFSFVCPAFNAHLQVPRSIFVD
jgi:hypothetical protein